MSSKRFKKLPEKTSEFTIRNYRKIILPDCKKKLYN